MKLLILVLKIILIMQYAYFIKIYINAKKKDESMNLSFGLISLVEFFGIVGISIAFVFSVILESYSIYLCFFGVLINIYIFFMLKRIIVMGDDLVLLKEKIVKIKNINKMEINFYSAKFKTRDNRFNIIGPIINFDTLRKQSFDKVIK